MHYHGRYLTSYVCTFYTAPVLSAVITVSGRLGVGHRYSLTCEVRGDERLNGFNRRLRWDRVGGSMGISREPTLTFNSLSLGDAGEYRCTSNFASSYLIGTRTVVTTVTISKLNKLVLPGCDIENYFVPECISVP